MSISLQIEKKFTKDTEQNCVLPTQTQIENFIAFYRRNNGDNNNIIDVVNFIKSHVYSDTLLEDEMFFFGLKYDQKNEPIIHDGSAENHFRVCVTTKKMLRLLDQTLTDFPSMFHIDSTFKINKNGFPLVVFGRSDIHRQFHSIAFMLTSHEKECDYFYFYNALVRIANVLNIQFLPDYIVQDGCDAMRNAAITIFKEKSQVLMCFFHLKKNVCKILIN